MYCFYNPDVVDINNAYFIRVGRVLRHGEEGVVLRLCNIHDVREGNCTLRPASTAQHQQAKQNSNIQLRARTVAAGHAERADWHV